ncbi:LLM class flavin-dependent oxidoreductase [Nocardia sp. NPDC052112]|uniref:LLM class flavin-dependent oxidoreductase n=1 Tax=Nocardia sp. NPDC052112 TaxID=3155646 RepID=UPI003422A9BD
MTTEHIADQIRFAYWVPNVSGGLVTSDIEQRTGWDFEYNKKLARTAENNWFFIIARDTAKEAHDTLREILGKANKPAVAGFRDAVQQAGASTKDRKGMWADSTSEDLAQYNDGFRTKLIGTPEQVAERIVAYKQLGVDLMLADFLHFQEEVEYFGAKVLPLVRELEAARTPAAVGH